MYVYYSSGVADFVWLLFRSTRGMFPLSFFYIPCDNRAVLDVVCMYVLCQSNNNVVIIIIIHQFADQPIIHVHAMHAVTRRSTLPSIMSDGDNVLIDNVMPAAMIVKWRVDRYS